MSQNKEFCYVLMPFTDEMNEIYYFIKRTVEGLGLDCRRADEDINPQSIIGSIVESICNAKVIIADLTNKNANVLYELGISHSFGNNSLVIVQKDFIDELPFDIKSYRVIPYENTIPGAKKLEADLKKRLSSIDSWIDKPNNPVQDYAPKEKLERVPKEKFDEITSLASSLKLQLSKSQKEVINAEKIKKEIEKLRDENKELGTMKDLFMRLFHNAFPTEGKGRVNVIEVAKKIFEELESNGEFSLDVKSETHQKTTEQPGRIIFKKVKDK